MQLLATGFYTMRQMCVVALFEIVCLQMPGIRPLWWHEEKLNHRQLSVRTLFYVSWCSVKNHVQYVRVAGNLRHTYILHSYMTSHKQHPK